MSGPVLDPAWRAALGGGDLIETHAAWVVLSGPSAFKLKKPVARGYLDFTSVERRRAALQAELDLNAGHAPQIYRRLSWLTRQGDGAIALNGVGQRAEPVLEMVRFDQGLLLDDLARDGRFDGALARDLADAVFMSHEAAPVASASEGGAARIRGVLARAASACAAEPGVDATRIAALSRALDTRLEARRDLLDARAVAGFVRRCHGDLHLQNIVCLEGHPVLFDALEFDEALATTDTLYDLAFLLMDLTHRGLGAIAAAVLSQYLARLDDDLGLAGLALLPAFCGLRALIKAMTRLQRGEDGDMHEAGLYLALAERCAVVSPPRLIGVGGLSGTGKSTLAEALAPDLGAPPGAVVIRADLERKALEGVSWRVELPKSAYTRDASQRVYARQRGKAARIVRAGLSVIVDAVHSKPDERDALETIAAEAGAAFCGFWLEADGGVLRDRVAARTGDPSDADVSVVEKQAGYDAGVIRWSRIDAGRGANAVLEAARGAAGLA